MPVLDIASFDLDQIQKELVDLKIAQARRVLFEGARATGVERYRELAAYFIDQRGRSPNYFELEAKRRGELDLRLRGQCEALFSKPHFVARDAAGQTVADQTWDEGTRLQESAGDDSAVPTSGAFGRGHTRQEIDRWLAKFPADRRRLAGEAARERRIIGEALSSIARLQNLLARPEHDARFAFERFQHLLEILDPVGRARNVRVDGDRHDFRPGLRLRIQAVEIIHAPAHEFVRDDFLFA